MVTGSVPRKPVVRSDGRNLIMRTRCTLIAIAILSTLPAAPVTRADELTIDVHADRVKHTVTRHLTGACIEAVWRSIPGWWYAKWAILNPTRNPKKIPPSRKLAFSRFICSPHPWRVGNRPRT